MPAGDKGIVDSAAHDQGTGSCPAAGGSYPLIVGSATSAVNLGSIRSTYGNNGNTSTNGRRL
jgi:hypothetical protein